MENEVIQADSTLSAARSAYPRHNKLTCPKVTLFAAVKVILR
jgi:hypothetical protein